jgi:peptide/nickel transport system permease protein
VWKQVLARLMLAVPLLACVATLVFLLLELTPGEPVDLFLDEHTSPALQAALENKYCLRCPLHQRYGSMLVRLASADLGRSTAPGRQDQQVTDLIAGALPYTVVLSGLALLWAFPAGAALGTVQALRSGRAVDLGATAASLTLAATPEFLLALVALSFGSRWLGLPTSGWVDPLGHGELGAAGQLVDHVRHLVLPVGVMGLGLVGSVARYTRAAVLEQLRLDFVRTARAKGLPEGQVVLRPALTPLVVRLGLAIPLLASGAVVVERAFALPGMGRLLVQASLEQDAPVLIGCLFVFCSLVVVGGLGADLVGRWVDPRTGSP